MAMHTRVELSGRMAGVVYRGSTARIQAIMSRTDEVSLRHMHDALDSFGEKTANTWRSIAPVGRGNPGTLAYGGSTPPRAAGTYKASIRHRVVRTHDDVLLEVYSTDPVSEYIEKGTGIYARGVTSRRLIRAVKGDVMAVPADHVRVGGSKRRVKLDEGGSEKQTLDVRFLKVERGQRAQNIAGRAQTLTRPLLGPILRTHAYLAKRELLRMVKGT